MNKNTLFDALINNCTKQTNFSFLVKGLPFPNEKVGILDVLVFVLFLSSRVVAS